MVTADVVVAGAGHNSLVAAAYLAKAGYEVCVLEARELIGGGTASEQLNLPGFVHDTCSTFQPTLMGSPVFRDDELGLLADYGLELVRPELGCLMPFPDGTVLTQYLDPQRTWESLAAVNRRDADTYLRLLEEWDAVKGAFGKAANTPGGAPPELDRRWQRRVAMSAYDVILHEFEDERVRQFMGWFAMLTVQPIQRPGGGQLAVSVAANRQQHGWLVFRGGTGAFADALGRLIVDQGGTILTSKEVTRLVLDGSGRCVGVETADGDELRARKAVLSTIHVKHLVDMAPAGAWDEDFRLGVDTWRAGGTLFVTYCDLAEPPVVGGVEAPVFGPGVPLQRLLRIGHDWETGTVSTDDPSLLVVCTSLVDPSRAPEGRHVLKIVDMQPYDIPGGPARWDELKEEVSQAGLAQVRRFAPNLTAEKILARTVKSPLDLERTNRHNWHGSCHGGDASPSQSGRFRFHQRTPVPGLYQTGATTFPGGSVTAAPGRNAAQVLLADLGRSLAEVVGG
jgi:phytoene dehydrogenase-like protein